MVVVVVVINQWNSDVQDEYGVYKLFEHLLLLLLSVMVLFCCCCCHQSAEL